MTAQVLWEHSRQGTGDLPAFSPRRLRMQLGGGSLNSFRPKGHFVTPHNDDNRNAQTLCLKPPETLLLRLSVVPAAFRVIFILSDTESVFLGGLAASSFQAPVILDLPRERKDNLPQVLRGEQ